MARVAAVCMRLSPTCMHLGPLCMCVCPVCVLCASVWSCVSHVHVCPVYMCDADLLALPGVTPASLAHFPPVSPGTPPWPGVSGPRRAGRVWGRAPAPLTGGVATPAHAFRVGRTCLFTNATRRLTFKTMFVLLQLKTIERLREFPVTPKQRENSTTASSGACDARLGYNQSVFTGNETVLGAAGSFSFLS